MAFVAFSIFCMVPIHIYVSVGVCGALGEEVYTPRARQHGRPLAGGMLEKNKKKKKELSGFYL
ncbi:uncharacterized protein SETTUDRAFT_168193 [Exserohilum turcica Et28A]|uniref:Uncharacterized protein n=1 Tax=Exserohilum turcicum (strain 28A) TaxID=671987 RepID=R0KM21_EXST2|nr:uncharacterized protein SETTUDRAFT_168193 [Exserohilum turcica Et28A]EOA88987.1 hypothetical protein SETTUDRAFT_168193 [Exserohilum turcica Et28A]